VSETQAHAGRHQLIERLAAQIGSRAAAIEILQKRGHVDAKGNLTAEGRKRDNMTAKERALDRASKASGKPSSAFTYNPKTNTTKLK